MRILYISCEDVPANHAGAVHTSEVAKNLTELGCEVTLLSLLRDDQSSFEIINGIRIFRTRQKFGGIKFPILNIKHLPSLLSKRYDIIMERHITASGLGMILSRLTKTPLVLEVNSPHLDEVLYRWDIKNPIFSFLMRWWVNLNFKQANGVITTRPSIIPDFSRDKGLYLYWGANEKKFNPELSNTPIAEKLIDRYNLKDRFVVIFVGSFRIWQGAVDVPDILEKTKKLIPSIQLLLLGAGEGVEGLLNELEKRNLKEHYTFLGKQPHNLMPYYMAISDVGLAPFNDNYYPPLKKFGFFWAPSKIMEYLASGLPVITSRNDTLENIVGDGERGILVDTGKVDDYAEAIHKIYSDEDIRFKMARNAREYILKKQTWKIHCSEIFKLFKRIIKR